MLPHWPAEVHYTGVGYGAYPFWKGNEGAKDHAPIEVWYSERLASEKFSHSACSLDLVGDPGATKGTKVPCVHLMVGTVHPRPHEAAGPEPAKAQAYLYSADETFCCRSTGSPEDLSPPTSHFMDKMTLDGNRTNITTASCAASDALDDVRES